MIQDFIEINFEAKNRPTDKKKKKKKIGVMTCNAQLHAASSIFCSKYPLSPKKLIA